LSLEFWNSSGVKGFELGILQGYNHEKHVSSTGGVRILNGIAHFNCASYRVYWTFITELYTSAIVYI
jgi:hypothetical protein